ncbi:hypothetical protein [Gorillibacterium sp. sgz500922]|uniref:hypothetical protein n=1 Tax=Gorillibacterium sp. sgz500922 TaxID=3446694 RepID=UPI003F681FBD
MDIKLLKGWTGKRGTIRAIWFAAAAGLYLLGEAFGLQLTRPYAYTGLLLILLAMIAERTLVGGTRTRSEFFLDRSLFGDKPRQDRMRFASAALFYALPLLAMPLLDYFLIR